MQHFIKPQTVSVLHAALHQTTDCSRLYQFFMQYFIKLQTAQVLHAALQTTPILRATLHQTTDWDYIVLYAALHQITC